MILINQNGKKGIDRKAKPLLLGAEYEKGRVQHNQKKREGQPVGRKLPQQHGGTRQPAVIQMHRGEEKRNADGVGDAGEKEKQKISQPEFFEFFFELHENTPIFVKFLLQKAACQRDF